MFQTPDTTPQKSSTAASESKMAPAMTVVAKTKWKKQIHHLEKDKLISPRDTEVLVAWGQEQTNGNLISKRAAWLSVVELGKEKKLLSQSNATALVMLDKEAQELGVLGSRVSNIQSVIMLYKKELIAQETAQSFINDLSGEKADLKFKRISGIFPAFASLALKDSNSGGIEIDKDKAKLLFSILLDSKENGQLPEISAYLEIVRNHKKHTSIASRVSNDSGSHTDPARAVKEVREWLDKKLKLVIQASLSDPMNSADVGLARLNSVLRASLNSLLD